jgi:hypothetical protein
MNKPGCTLAALLAVAFVLGIGTATAQGIIGVISSNVPDTGSATCTPTGTVFGESAPWDLHTGIRGLAHSHSGDRRDTSIQHHRD